MHLFFIDLYSQHNKVENKVENTRITHNWLMVIPC